MKIKQVYEIVNDAQKQVLGEESLIQEDLSDVVSVGESIKTCGARPLYARMLKMFLAILLINAPTNLSYKFALAIDSPTLTTSDKSS